MKMKRGLLINPNSVNLIKKGKDVFSKNYMDLYALMHIQFWS